MVGHVALYQNLKTKTVLVRRCARYMGGSTETGRHVEIVEEELPTRLVPEVLRALETYATEPLDEAVARAMQLDAKARREHSHVSISRDAGGAITVVPHLRTRGGSMGYDEDVVRVPPGASQQALCSSVVGALAKAGTARFHTSISRTRTG